MRKGDIKFILLGPVILFGSLNMIFQIVTMFVMFIRPIYHTLSAFTILDGVERNRQIAVLLKFWLINALVLTAEVFIDFLFSWLPLYSTGKLIFFYYLVCDNYSQCIFIHDQFISVHFLRHKSDIDNSITSFRAFIGSRVALLLAQGRQLVQVHVVDRLRPFLANALAGVGQVQQPQPQNQHQHQHQQ